jgi:hypothetical protein
LHDDGYHIIRFVAMMGGSAVKTHVKSMQMCGG